MGRLLVADCVWREDVLATASLAQTIIDACDMAATTRAVMFVVAVSAAHGFRSEIQVQAERVVPLPSADDQLRRGASGATDS